MYTTGTAMTGAAAGGGVLAYTGVSNIWFAIALGFLFLLLGAGLVAYSARRTRMEARIAGV